MKTNITKNYILALCFLTIFQHFFVTLPSGSSNTNGIIFEEEVRRLALGYQFCIDTGDISSVYCQSLLYRFNESKLTRSQVPLLENCFGSWKLLILLTSSSIKKQYLQLKNVFDNSMLVIAHFT